MGRDNDYPELSPRERERTERREKKRQPGMVVSGRSIFTLAQIIREKAEGVRSLAGKGKRKKRGKRKKHKKRRKKK